VVENYGGDDGGDEAVYCVVMTLPLPLPMGSLCQGYWECKTFSFSAKRVK